MRRKHSLRQVEKELCRLKGAITAMRDIEVENGRLPLHVAAIVYASQVPHIDACLKYLEHLRNEGYRQGN